MYAHFVVENAFVSIVSLSSSGEAFGHSGRWAAFAGKNNGDVVLIHIA